jgi:hypothetical protein
MKIKLVWEEGVGGCQSERESEREGGALERGCRHYRCHQLARFLVRQTPVRTRSRRLAFHRRCPARRPPQQANTRKCVGQGQGREEGRISRWIRHSRDSIPEHAISFCSIPIKPFQVYVLEHGLQVSSIFSQ